MKKDARKSGMEPRSIVWLCGFLVLFAFVFGWPIFALCSESASPLIRGIAIAQLVLFAGITVGSIYFEAKRKRVIRETCIAEGFKGIEIRRRKTHYRVVVSGPQGEEIRKCRVLRHRDVEWLA